MLTEEQKKGLELLYNGYSFNEQYALRFGKDEWSDKMEALRSAVSILGYKFEPDCRAKKDGIEYTEYDIVKINEIRM